MNELVSAGILAGGKSSRMGADKAHLMLGEQTFLERAVTACRDFSSLCIAVDDIRRFPDVSCAMVEDEIKGFGPVEGIYQLLKASSVPYVLVIATDMPFLDRVLLNRLADCATGEEDCVILTADGKIQPLCSIYKKSLIPLLEQMRTKGEHKIRLLYSKASVRYVDIKELGGQEIQLKNINTREEYDETVKRFL